MPLSDKETPPYRRVPSDIPFVSALVAVSLMYVLLIVGMLAADVHFMGQSMTWDQIVAMLSDKNIVDSIVLTLISCTLAAIFSVIVSIPIGYLLSRYNFRGKNLCDAVLDIPIVRCPLPSIRRAIKESAQGAEIVDFTGANK